MEVYRAFLLLFLLFSICFHLQMYQSNDLELAKYHFFIDFCFIAIIPFSLFYNYITAITFLHLHLLILLYPYRIHNSMQDSESMPFSYFGCLYYDLSIEGTYCNMCINSSKLSIIKTKISK